MRRGATDTVMVSRGDAETRRVCPKGRGSFRATLSTSHVPWPKAKLGEVAIEFIDGDRGKNYPKQHDFSSKGHCLFLNAENVTSEGFKFDALKFISEEKDHSLRKGKVSRGDVILTTRGTVGNAAIYDEDVPFANVRINSGMVILRCDNRKVLPSYLYFCLRTQDFLSQVNGFKSGVAQPQLPIKDLKQIEILIPPLPVQRRIADILSAYDDLIENNRRRIAILEESARRIFEAEIVNGTWECEPVNALVEVNPEVPKPTCDGIRYIPMSALSTSGMTVDLSDSEIRVQSTSVRFLNGDVLLARITPCLENGKTAYVNFLADGEIGCGSSEFIVLRGKRVSPYFTYCLTRLEAFRGIAIKSMIGASGRQRVQLSCFSDFQIQVPDDATLRHFDAIVAPMFDQIGILSKQSAALAAARDMLLPRLMKGGMMRKERHDGRA